MRVIHEFRSRVLLEQIHYLGGCDFLGVEQRVYAQIGEEDSVLVFLILFVVDAGGDFLGAQFFGQDRRHDVMKRSAFRTPALTRVSMEEDIPSTVMMSDSPLILSRLSSLGLITVMSWYSMLSILAKWLPISPAPATMIFISGDYLFLPFRLLMMLLKNSTAL